MTMRSDVPCLTYATDLWFSQHPGEVEEAKELYLDCPLRPRCLSVALERREPWGVWGGELFDNGHIVARKRPRGRPRKTEAIPC